MSRVVPFQPEHFDALAALGTTEGTLTADLPPGFMAELARGNSWAILRADGRPIACVGVAPHWPRRYRCWAILAADAGPHMGAVTRATRKLLNEACEPGRYEMEVRFDFEQGVRWAKLLGFHVETPRLERFTPDGRDYVGMVRFIGM